MNTAHTRSWEILPGAFLLTQFPMPENRQLNVQMRLSDSMRKIDWPLKIPDGCDSALVFISAPARDNIRFHIFPFFK